jgi:hypothetical protein
LTNAYLEISPKGQAKVKGFPVPLEKIFRKELDASDVVIAFDCASFSHFWGSIYQVAFSITAFETILFIHLDFKRLQFLNGGL